MLKIIVVSMNKNILLEILGGIIVKGEVLLRHPGVQLTD